jgi:PhnB protein
MPPPSSPVKEVFAYLCVQDAAAAATFYQQAFGAVEKFRLVEPSGRIGHMELQLGPAVLMLNEPFPEFDIVPPPATGVPCVRVHLHMDDADAVAARAVALGATLLTPPTDQFYGERSCRIRDPYGHTWLLGHEIEAMSVEEMQRRYTALMGGAG